MRKTCIPISAVLVLVVAGCAPAKSEPARSAPAKPAIPLSGVVGQNIIVAPVQGMWVAPELGWPAPVARRELARLDSVIADTLRDRVGNREWVFADGVEQAWLNNRTYVSDPRALAVAPLRSTRIKLDDRLPEPLASQVRTMIALQDARLVLIPVELRVNATTPPLGRPTLRLVLVDPRMSVVRWIGEVHGAESSAITPGLPAAIASGIADLFVAK